jgi:thiol-disulfide isomerase/thioredoxin
LRLSFEQSNVYGDLKQYCNEGVRIMKRTKILLIAVCFLVVIAFLITCFGSSRAAAPPLQDSADRAAKMQAAREAFAHPFENMTGKTADNFTLQTLDGKVIQIATFKGRPMILSFFRVKECPPCMDQLDVLSKIDEKYRKSKVAIIALIQQRVGLESSREDIEKVLRSVGVRYPVAYATQDMATAYGKSKIVPYNVYVNASGKIIHQAAGQDIESMDQAVRQLLESK